MAKILAGTLPEIGPSRGPPMPPGPICDRCPIRYLFDMSPGSTYGRADPDWIIEFFQPSFRSCMDTIFNIAYMQIGIGNEKQS